MSVIPMAVVTVLTSVVQVTGPAALRPTSAEDFRASAVEVRRATLNDLASQRFSPEPEVTGALIASGLKDATVEVRLSAIYALAGRAATARFGKREEHKALWAVERPTLLRLRSAALEALGDSSAKVRQGAIIALVNLAYEQGAPINNVRLSGDVTAVLARQYQTEAEASVRAEIMKTFALTSVLPDGRETTLVRGLSDDVAEVVKYAVLGLGRARSQRGLKLVADRLSHSDRGVRLQVAQAMVSYGLQAKAYLDLIQNAADSEENDVVKRTLEEAVAAMLTAMPAK